MGGKCRRSSPQGRTSSSPLQAVVKMNPGSLLFAALLLTGLAAAQEDESRKGAGVKGECKRTGPKPSDKLFAKYTIPIKNKKCPCWWDMSKKICVCCKRSKMGCPGVCNNKYTLSGKGFPCYNDKSKGNTCAWCAAGGFQCYADGTTGPDSKDGSRCQDQKNQKYCTSVQGDC